MAGLKKFIEEVRNNGLARSNHFEVLIATPPALKPYSEDLRIIQLFCEQASIPGISYSTQGVRTYGEIRETIYDRNYEDVTLTFLVDRKMKVKNFFDSWSDIIINPYSRINGYYLEYTSNISITILDTNSKPMYKTMLVEAFPKAIQSISIDNNSKDVMRLPVTFNYRYHESTHESQFVDENAEAEKPPRTSAEVPYAEDFYSYQKSKNVELLKTKAAAFLLERQSFITGRGGFIR